MKAIEPCDTYHYWLKLIFSICLLTNLPYTYIMLFFRDFPKPKKATSPTRAKVTNSSRHSRLVARFNDLYAIKRLDMQVYCIFV